MIYQKEYISKKLYLRRYTYKTSRKSFLLKKHKGSPRARPTIFQQRSFVRIVNAVGFYSTRFSRLLSNESLIRKTSKVRSIKEMQHIKREMYACMHACMHPRNPQKFCAVLLTNGGITKGFKSRSSLAEFIYARFGEDWVKKIKLKPNKNKAWCDFYV